MSDQKPKLSKEELIKRKKIALLKKRKEEAAASKKKKVIEQNLITDEERIGISKELKSNALAVFSRFSYYKTGYHKTLGILIFSILITLMSSYSLIYSMFMYKAPNVYLPVNSIGQLVDPVPLTEPLFTDNEIRKFSADAFSAISNYNYVTVNSTYFTDISEWFTPKSFKVYKDDFNNGSEIKVVKENFFVVKEITVREATINKKEGESLRKKSPNVYLWVVNLKSKRIYQNRTGFAYEDYNTRIIVTRSPVRINERGLAIHSIVNEKINKSKK